MVILMNNLQEIIKVCRAYANSTEIPAFIIDEQGKLVTEGEATVRKALLHSRSITPDNPFCHFIHTSPERREECYKAHLYGSYQAEKFGEAYVFFCPFGLIHWVSPILNDYHIQHSLVAGPVLMSKPEDTLIEEILRKNGLTEEEIVTLREKMMKVPFVHPRRVNDLAILLSSLTASLSNLNKKKHLDKREYFEQQSSISRWVQEYKSTKGGDGPYPLSKERKLTALIRRGDKAGAQEVLNEILGYIFFSQGNNLELIKTRVIELVVVLSRAAVEGGAEIGTIFGLNHRFLWDITDLSTIDEIAFWLSKVMARFTDCVFNLVNVKNVDIIYRAVSFLRENYMNQISLERIAKEVHLSPAYFSKLFKDEMKCNFNTYLNTLRVEYSKEFLLNKDLSLAVIAGLVGFEDQSYFTKVFKKLAGTSPGEYRRLRGLETI